ncbi:nucleotidyltransferase family protein [Kordiimonas aestuarii]|uniref:nucleotidyltransferase family protein n=1 Tax=Kordiimonas aestuarii TaxID=1005925 RepID=UPI0021CEF82C|nr:nucleotidyltransferase family protein [Kordiimonas aestuarii]
MNEIAMYEFEANNDPDHLYEFQQHDSLNRHRRDFTAIVLAGTRRADDPVAALIGGQFKALVPICGEPMVSRVVKALAKSGSVKRIVVVFDEPELLFDACPALQAEAGEVVIEVLPCAETICCSVASTIEAAKAEWPYLVTTADHALLTPTMVDKFCSDARMQTGLAVGFVERSYLEAAHPGSKRTYLPFKETQLSGANLFAFMSEEALPVLDFWRSIEQKRKKPWTLFKAFGYRNLFGLLFKRFTVDQAFERASIVLGVNASAVRLPFAEAAIDVDTALDFEQVSRILELRETAVLAY